MLFRSIGFIGGSITEGAAASSYDKNYASLVTEWYKTQFPKTPVRCVNAGLGASSSNMGSHRVDDNLLKHKPDLVVCEFAVNDNGNDLVPETMEGIVRQVLKSEQQPAVILLFMCDQNGKNIQDQHIPIGRHYDLPMISFRDGIFPEVAAGNLKWEDIEVDTVHPNDVGHRYIADIVTSLFQTTRDKMPAKPELEKKDDLPRPMSSNRFEHTTMLCAKNSVAASNEGWSSDDAKGPYRQFFGNGWLSDKPGSVLQFDIKGSFISIVYHLDKQKDFGMISVQVDDREPIPCNAYAGWIWNGGMCVWKPVATDLPYGWHKVKITMLDEKDKDSSVTRVRFMAVMAAGESQ